MTWPTKLAGRCNIDYDMQSGYMPVSSGEFLFYIYNSPYKRLPDGQPSPYPDDPTTPIIMWTNGMV